MSASLSVMTIASASEATPIARMTATDDAPTVADPEGEEERHRPDEVELLLDAQRPVVEQRRRRRRRREIVAPAQAKRKFATDSAAATPSPATRGRSSGGISRRAATASPRARGPRPGAGAGPVGRRTSAKRYDPGPSSSRDEQAGDEVAGEDEEDVDARGSRPGAGSGPHGRRRRGRSRDLGGLRRPSGSSPRPHAWAVDRRPGAGVLRVGARPPGATDSAAGHRPSEAASRLAPAAADERARATLRAARLAELMAIRRMRRSWDRLVPESPRYPSLVVGTSDAVSRNARYTDRSISHSPEVA